MNPNQIFPRGRPAGVDVVTISLAWAGFLVLFASLPFFLTGLFSSPVLLRLSAVIAGVGVIYIVLACGFQVGCRWAWCGAAFLTPPLGFFAWWISGSGSQILEYASWLLGALVILVQSVVWRGAIRRWFWRRHEVGCG